MSDEDVNDRLFHQLGRVEDAFREYVGRWHDPAYYGPEFVFDEAMELIKAGECETYDGALAAVFADCEPEPEPGWARRIYQRLRSALTTPN